MALKVLASRTPLDEISFGREKETDEDRQLVTDMARQEVARLFGLKIVENSQAEAEAGSPQPVTVEEGAKIETELTPEQIEKAISLLKSRFNAKKNKDLCPTLYWQKAEKTLRETPSAIATVLKAEAAGHEPTICLSDETGFEIATRSDETPQSTRDCVYDEEAEQLRKRTHPNEQFNGNAITQAREMGWDIQEVALARHIAANTPSYREKEWSWLKTDPKTRVTGDALAGYRLDNDVYVVQDDARYHSADGAWRGSLRVNFVA